MSSASAEGRQPDLSLQPPPPQQQPVDTQPLHPSELLSQILALSEDTSPKHLDDLPEISLLRDTARRHAGQPLLQEPILTELLQAILKPVRGISAGAHARMLRQVAQTMWDDAESRRRLLEFWASLQRSITHDS